MIKKEIHCDRCKNKKYIELDDNGDQNAPYYHTIWIDDNTVDIDLCGKCYTSLLSWLSND